jgi:acyl-CoA thioesterase
VASTTTRGREAQTRFERAIAIEPLGDGRFRAEISPSFFAAAGPNGGYLAALIVRAMEHAVDDPERYSRSLTLHYLRPASAGPCELSVTIERAGRSITTLTARLEQEGRPIVLAIGAFSGAQASAADYVSPAPMPGRAPRPAPVADDRPATPMLRELLVEPVFGGAPFGGSADAVTGGWLTLTEPRDLDAAELAFFCDAWLPSPWTRMEGFSPAPTMDLTIHFRARLPLVGVDPRDPVLVHLHSTTATEGFFEEDASLWATDGTLLVQSRQLGLLRPG